MVRKPQPKDAARKLASFLTNEGVTLDNRKLLDMVAIVEGHKDWQTMSASLKGTENAPTSKAAGRQTPRVRDYTRAWAQVEAQCRSTLMELRDMLERALGDSSYSISVPQPDTNSDDFSVGITVLENPMQPGPVEDRIQVTLELRQAEDDEQPTEDLANIAPSRCLKFGHGMLLNVVDARLGDTVATQVPLNYSSEVWTWDIEELRGRASSDVMDLAGVVSSIVARLDV
ncbi:MULTISPECIES: glyoxalase superfamily protein [unclassified Variovorax]|uniref:glyoxalase superfamily protein n=1 Tax=unclassified Variovorax TaxID=663243 RepID=UPI00076C8660|nr:MULTISPECIES: glyoxalase superfamily protein [unclassified Variovorax]KWT98091.1 hypothetical protein APY03_0762 [Variovorax sp. WDL1]PNG50434.1 hypothetical protein CHC06_06058 [Variovorax sp. B2]PNG51307.1 hypothetical protein CHC07_05964 [Variovorax sp. B4]VTV17566.1 hypothetical protein WDL1P1_00490 [Variovorax sp. WDL1]